MIYQIFDIFFVVFHSILIIFNITGWIWKKARFINLITLIITGLSWLLLGIIVGTLGYCPLTDWHFNVLYRLGEKDLPDSYIKYLFDRITGQDIDATLVNNVTLYVFIIVLIISAILNIRDLRHRRTNRPED